MVQIKQVKFTDPVKLPKLPNAGRLVGLRYINFEKSGENYSATLEDGAVYIDHPSWPGPVIVPMERVQYIHAGYPEKSKKEKKDA